MQHAHQKGIIHRDLKPSNILVTLHDGVAVPKVIDFGIAKATEGRLTDLTIYTELHQFIGTPAYMSPEQAEMSGLDIDTRSDIYSLGVLLYELLTGHTPFDAKELLEAGLDAMRRTIRETEPQRPSTRLSTMMAADLTVVARRQGADAPKLIHLIRGDLDWIVMKCLEKDRSRRYETANGLAADIHRHVTNEPVVARPPTVAYRCQKAWRRNKIAFMTATAVALALVFGIVVSSWQGLRARRAERIAAARLVDSEKARGEAEAISTFLTQVFQSPDPNRDGRTITVAEALGRATKKLETDLANQPDRQAKLNQTIGATYQAIGLAHDAIPLLEKAGDYYAKERGLEHPDTLSAMNELANVYTVTARHDEVLALRRELLTLTRKTKGPKDPATLQAMHGLVHAHSQLRQESQALQLLDEAFAISRELKSQDSQYIQILGELAHCYFHAQRSAKGIALQEEALALGRKINGVNHTNTLLLMNNLSVFYSSVGRTEASFKLMEEVLTASRKVRGPEHPGTLSALLNLAMAHQIAGHPDEAIKLGEESVTLMRKVNGLEHFETIRGLNTLASIYKNNRRGEDAVKLLEENLASQRKVSGPESSATLAAMESLADMQHETGRKEQALRLREEMFTLRRKGLGSEHPTTIQTMQDLAMSFEQNDRKPEALELRQETLALSRKVNGSDDLSTIYAIHYLAESLMAAKRQDEALKHWDEELSLIRRNCDPADGHTVWLKNSLANSYRKAGRTEDAVKLREELLELRKKEDPQSPATGWEFGQLGLTLDAAGRGDEAIQAWQKAIQIRPKDTTIHNWLVKALIDRQRTAEALELLGREPLTGHPDAVDRGKRMATIYLWLGQTNEYHAICRRLLELTADSADPMALERAAKAYLIQPHLHPAALPNAVLASRRALDLASAKDVNRPWFLITAAMGVLRNGAPAHAEPWLDEALQVSANDVERRNLALAYRALARTLQGRIAEARSDLAELEKRMPLLPARHAPSSLLLSPDTVAAHLARAEAESMLPVQAPHPTQP